MIELISLYKIGVFFIFSKFLILLAQKKEIFQKITPW